MFCFVTFVNCQLLTYCPNGLKTTNILMGLRSFIQCFKTEGLRGKLNKVVLAYSGGLDTSVIVPWLRNPATKPLIFQFLRSTIANDNINFNNGYISISAAQLCFYRQIPPPEQQQEQVQPVFTSISLPFSRVFHSSTHTCLHHTHRQVSLLLPHYPSSPSLLQPPTPLLTTFFSSSSTRTFSTQISHTGDDDDDDDDDDIDSECQTEKDVCLVESEKADPVEVHRVCKVIDELFATDDRNMEAVLDHSQLNLSHDLVVNVLHRFCHARKPAFRFFCWAGQKLPFEHNSITYNAMMEILGKTRQFETMVSMLDEMADQGVLTMETLIIAMKAFAAAKERKKAVGIFELMKKYKYKVGVDTINLLLDALGRAKLGKEAQVIFDKLEERFTPNLRTYTVLLNGWCRVKNLMEAGRVWNEMIDKGFKPDIVAHNTMLEGLFKSKRISDAIKLFEVMKAKGPSPNVRTYTILIKQFCKQRKMKEAEEYFDEMIEAGCQPDAAVYTCLITGFGHQRRLDIVHELLTEMNDKGCPPDGHTYNALIKLMTSQRWPDDAARIYKRMIQNGIEPTIHTFNMMMKSYFQTRNYDMGRAVWDEMKQKGCCPDENSYTVFIGGLISEGRSGEACKYLEEMLEKGMKAPQLDYNKFAADFSRVGKPDVLEELAQKMKFSGKFEASNIFARWAEMMKKRVKRRNPLKTAESISDIG